MERSKKTQTPASVRGIALELLLAVMEEGAFCDKALHAALDNTSLDKRDRSFLTRLTEGTVERCMELDAILDQFSKVKVQKMKPVIRNILRLAVYQIRYMEQVPASAACNEAVKLTVKKGFGSLKGFVNGVLRNIVRAGDGIAFPEKTDGTRYLSVRYSMPEWIVERFIEDYGEEAEQILAAFLQEKDGTSIRCMTSRFTLEDIRACLKEEGVQTAPGKLFPYALRIRGYASIQELRAFQKGMFQVQDESSMLTAQIAGIRKGDTVLDICAAPGGKTLHAADILAGSGRVLSADLSREKTAFIRENCERLQVENVEVFEQDARLLREEWKGMADVLIADLPCSGLGVIGKKCDIKYKTKKEDIMSLALLQRQMLRVASEYVKEGGRLIYSTCTIAREENEENVRWIVDNLPFSLVSIEKCLPEALRNQTGEKGYLQILPNRSGTDGFFVAAFEKVG